MRFATLASLAGISLTAVTAKYFSIGHPPLIRTRLDPIVSSGKIAGHVHSVIGSSAFAAEMTFESATAGQCSTSFIQADMSNYWAPQLYYKYKDGTYFPIQGDGLVAYWKFSSNDPNEKFEVVPDDFRMLGGDISRDFFDESIPSHAAVSFQCIGNGYDERLDWIPADRECETIRPQVFFPSCWNGVDSYLPDNSHVVYPLERFEGGPCPAGYKRIPNLFLEAYYKVKDNVPNYEWYPGCLVLANGDNFGLSYHSDWLNGWPKGMLVEAFESAQCALDGTVDGCPIFEASRDEEKSRSCAAQGELVNEVIGLGGALAALPGNNAEYNSSKSSADHVKQSRAGYAESSLIINVPANGTGICTKGKCTDYDGPTGGGAVQANVPEEDGTDQDDDVEYAGSSGASSSAAAQLQPSASAVPEVGTGNNLVADVDAYGTSKAAGATATKKASDMSCGKKRAKRRLGGA